jgi:hypothetical protein
MRFARAYKIHEGALDAEELAAFVPAVPPPGAD